MTVSDDGGAVRTPEHRTVSRVMAILEAVVANEPEGIRLGELSDMVHAPKSSIHGLAKGLVTTGYLREYKGRYRQGPAVAMLASGRPPIPVSFHRALEQLCIDAGESAILTSLVGESVINIDVVETDQMIRASPVLNNRRPLWPTSYGKVYLAFMDPRRREIYLRRTHTDQRELASILNELEEIRSTGVAFNREESIPGLYGVASPIITGGSDVTLAIGLAGPAARMKERADELAQRVLDTARALSSHEAK
ncbi:IclR family transcriptional regulator [bacterium RCC_150]